MNLKKMALSPAPAKLAELPSFPVESEDAPAEAHSRELNLYGTLHQRPSSHSYGGTQMLLHPSVGSQGRANSMGTPAEIEAAQVALYGGSAVAYQSGTAPTHSRVPVYMQSPGQLHATHSFPRGGMFPGVMNPMFVAPPGTIAPQMVNISSQSGVNSLLPSQVRAPMPMRYSTVPGNHDSSEFMLQGRMSTSEESSRSAMYAAGQVENNPPGAPPRYAPRYNSMVSSPYYAMGGDPRSPPTSGGYYATNASNHGHPSMDSASASALKGYYEGLAQSAARRHPSMMSVPPYPMPDPSIYSRSTGSYYAPIASPSLPYPFPPNFLSNAPVLPPGQSAVPALVTVVDGQAYAQILSMDSQTVPMNPTTGPTLPLSMLPMGTAQNIAELSRGAYNSSVYPPVAGVIPFSPSDPRYSQYMQVDPRHAYMYGKGVPIGEETVDTAVEHLNGIKPKVTVKEYAVEKSLFITQHDLKTNTMARREISLIFIHKNPSVYYMENFLTPEECQHMIDLCSGRLVPSKTSKGLESDVQEDYISSDSSNRTSYSVRLEAAETYIIETIENRAAAVAHMDVSHLEPLVVVKYDKGQYFKEHHDGKFRPVTVLIYLNEVEEGGETQFLRLGIKVLPSCGSALTWRNCDESGEADLNLLHEGLPPIKGVKWAVNCFFNCKPIRKESEQEEAS